METNDARGEKSCKACGLVRNDYEIDYGKDWRVFSDGEGTNNERTGMPQTNLLHDKGLTTDMGYGKTKTIREPLFREMPPSV